MEFWQTFILLLITSILSPWVVANQLNKSRARMQQADWDRQDKVIKAAAEAVDSLRTRQEVVAVKVAETAANLIASDAQRNVDAKAVVAKLDVIHDLTNSNLTAANARLDTALAEIRSLQNLITEMRSPAVTK